MVSNIIMMVSKIIHWYLKYFNLVSFFIKLKKSKIENILLEIFILKIQSYIISFLSITKYKKIIDSFKKINLKIIRNNCLLVSNFLFDIYELFLIPVTNYIWYQKSIIDTKKIYLIPFWNYIRYHNKYYLIFYSSLLKSKSI